MARLIDFRGSLVDTRGISIFLNFIVLLSLIQDARIRSLVAFLNLTSSNNIFPRRGEVNQRSLSQSTRRIREVSELFSSLSYFFGSCVSFDLRFFSDSKTKYSTSFFISRTTI